MSRPVIAILMDHQDEGSFSKRPHYALRCAYFDAIEAAGGLPVALPYLAGCAGDYADLADGVILPGGFYPFPAAWYGEVTPRDETIHPRAAFETDFTRILLGRDTPVLGICAGMQTLVGVMGGTLYRDVRVDPGTETDHLDARPAEEPAHPVRVTPGTLLHRITGQEAFDVNTAHREAPRDVPDGVTVNAVAPDGVIEGIELPDRRFALGVQWHPEFFREPGTPHRLILEALVAAATEAARSASAA